MSALISINDNNILIQQGDRISSTQGFAWLQGDEVVFDFDAQNTAVKACRLQPLQVHNRYWQQCAQTSVAVSNKNVRNSADLIWQHLSSIKRNNDFDAAVFIVPSHYQSDNLQLLLGIASAAGIESRGLVNKAVVITQHCARSDGKYIHIDVQLHQTVCSWVEVLNGVARLQDVDVLVDVSIQGIQDALLKFMQQSFIQGDRFDPLHYAATEQQLFDQLLPTAQSLGNDGKAMVVVQHSTHSYNIAIDNSQWNSVVKPFADAIFALAEKSPSAPFLLQLNNLFGGAACGAFDRDAVIVVDDALPIKSDLSGLASDGEDGLAYKLELPLLQLKEVVSNKLAVPLSKSPDINSTDVTHLVQNGLAVPLKHALLSLENGQLSLTYGPSSNVATLLSKQHVFILSDATRLNLQLNDRVGSNHVDGVLTAIRVME